MYSQIAALVDTETIKNLCRKHRIAYLALFGSRARGDERPDSDIDLLIEFTETRSLFDLMRVKLDFEAKFHKEVDLVVRGNMKQALRPGIERDLIVLYNEI